ncbi:glycosyltransferase [Salipiger sp. PrR002]|uniref:glycosyltransferase n=1 Tax=Salipiger sp. PrR002 TaxID=2706489 RepID=UPI0013BC55B3|nr:glycosyltransferase [Salipiger sp. PrR002]NDW01738.1 glycosyltransferase [Salipiger sp. PrR002]NDW57825.1 glycosyltransferase [Salipiger sp. PrR004]
MTPPKTPVAIAVCTFARQTDLACLLESLLALEISDRIDASVIVVDNDGARSAEPVVSAFAARCPWPVRYVSEPEPGIPIARNRAIAEAGRQGFLAFVDDDETVAPDWLSELFDVAQKTRAAFVQGPLVMTVEDHSDTWWLHSDFFRHKIYPDLSPRSEGWTNNVMVDLSFVAEKNCRFDSALRYDGGSDTLFFRDLTAAGGQGRFAAKAKVYEVQKKSRLNWRWAILRQYRYGITRANTVLLRRPLGYALLYCTMSGGAMLGLGVLKLPAALVKGRAGLADGVALIARGTGVFSGAMGLKRQEYAR